MTTENTTTQPVDTKKLGKKARRGIRKAAEAAKLQPDGTPKEEITPEQAAEQFQPVVQQDPSPEPAVQATPEPEPVQEPDTHKEVTPASEDFDPLNESEGDSRNVPTDEQVQELVKELEAEKAPEPENPVEPVIAPMPDAQDVPPAKEEQKVVEPAPAFAALAAAAEGKLEPKPQKAPKAEKKPGTGGIRSGGSMTDQEYRVLGFLDAAKKPLTRKELITLTQQKKGWSALLGAHTREAGSKGLVHSGHVQIVPASGESNVAYLITDKGREAYRLAKAARTITVPATPEPKAEEKETAAVA